MIYLKILNNQKIGAEKKKHLTFIVFQNFVSTEKKKKENWKMQENRNNSKNWCRKNTSFSDINNKFNIIEENDLLDCYNSFNFP